MSSAAILKAYIGQLNPATKSFFVVHMVTLTDFAYV